MNNFYNLRTMKVIAMLMIIFASYQNSGAQNIFALSGSNLIAFRATNPSLLIRNVPITGITPGQMLSGLDFRPATGQLYTIGYDASNGQSQLYTIDRTTGAATVINVLPTMLAAGINSLGFDFNPTVDRIRVTGDNNVNYRLHPETGALAATDGNLAFAATDVNAGMDPTIGAVAYSNSYIGATSTTLYNYDDSLNVFTTQAPPNAGTLNTIGSSGIISNMVDPSSDIDIYFNPSSLTNTAYFTANVSGISDELYTVDLTTGNTQIVGMIGNNLPIRDIAVRIIRNVKSTIAGDIIYALNTSNMLLTVDSESPDVIRHAEAISGITAGQLLSGLDFRPATGQLYSLGYDTSNGNAQLYTVDKNSGIATAVNATPITLALGKGKIGFDFNPTVDRIRITGSNNANYRLHPETGALAATDGNLAYAATDVNAGTDPSIGTAAYTNSFIGSTSTVLYNYDDSLNVLTSQIPPNAGTLNTIGSSGITVNPADPSTDLDITFDPAIMGNKAYFSANTGTSTYDMLYTIDVTTGAATSNGMFGYGSAIKDIAVQILRQKAGTPTGNIVYALTSTNVLISFDTDMPLAIRSSKTLSGFTAGQLLSGMDFRPATGDLYILGYDTANSNSQIYTLNKSTGVATAVNSVPVMLQLGKGKISFDFNPVADRIRIMGSNNMNYRLHPETGAIVSQDSSLAFAPGDINEGMDPSIGTAAYTNSYIGTTTTSLYDYDDSLNVLALQNPPNNGLLNTIGTSGIMASTTDPSSDLDIYYDNTSASNTAYLAANTTTSFDGLYTIDLNTGMTTLLSQIGWGISVKDIAAVIDNSVIRTTSTETTTTFVSSVGMNPNPVTTSGVLSFELNNDAAISIAITDISGRIIKEVLNESMTASYYQKEIDMSDLEPGVYLISVSGNNNIYSITKVIVQ